MGLLLVFFAHFAFADPETEKLSACLTAIKANALVGSLGTSTKPLPIVVPDADRDGKKGFYVVTNSSIYFVSGVSRDNYGKNPILLELPNDNRKYYFDYTVDPNSFGFTKLTPVKTDKALSNYKKKEAYDRIDDESRASVYEWMLVQTAYLVKKHEALIAEDRYERGWAESYTRKLERDKAAVKQKLEALTSKNRVKKVEKLNLALQKIEQDTLTDRKNREETLASGEAYPDAKEVEAEIQEFDRRIAPVFQACKAIENKEVQDLLKMLEEKWQANRKKAPTPVAPSTTPGNASSNSAN